MRFIIRGGQRDPSGSKPCSPNASWQKAPLSPVSSPVQRKVDTPHSPVAVARGKRWLPALMKVEHQSRGGEVSQQGIPVSYRGV